MRLEMLGDSQKYKNATQIARVMTENWVSQNLYCINCGNPHILQLKPNAPAADFACPKCNDQFELKSKQSPFSDKLVNGAYETLIARITSETCPNLLLMQYDRVNLTVRRLEAIPKRFLIPSVVERRKPLAITARRAGWVGSNILLHLLPKVSRIAIISDGTILNHDESIKKWQNTRFLDKTPINERGWIIDVLSCVDRISSKEFALNEIYQFEDELKKLHPENNNVRAKIRQQLQFLRDKGYIKFIAKGKYQKIE